MRGLVRATVAVAFAALLGACGASGAAVPGASGSTVSARTAGAPASSPPLCGFRAGPPAVTKVMVIWEENHSYGSIVGSSTSPELNTVIRSCGLATNAYSVTHPSLPNYLSETSAVSYARSPFNNDCSAGGSCTTGAPSLFAQESAAGHQWRSFAESMPANCFHSDHGAYAVRHNPAVYYPALAAQCEQWDVPLGSPTSGALATAVRDGLPAFSTLTPNVNHDMHNGTRAQGDRWLAQWLPVITNGPDYRAGRLAIVIVWDEGNGSGNQRSHIPLVVLSASTPAGTRSAAAYTDYSVVRTVEDLTGVPPLADAGAALSLAPAFHL